MSDTRTDWFKKTPYKSPFDDNPLPGNVNSWVKAKTPTELPEEKRGVSAKVVMNQYAQYEVRRRDQQQGMFNQRTYATTDERRQQAYEDGELYKKLVNYLREMSDFKNYTDTLMSVLVKNVTNMLQTADLTINFKADRWFATPNNS